MSDPRSTNGHAQSLSTVSLAETIVSSGDTTTLASSPQGSAFKSPAVVTLGSGPTLSKVIPPEHSSRTLVLCFDGTGDQFDSDNSNIVELFSMLKKDDRSKQMVYYQAGIGTYTSPQVATPFMSKISKMLDEAVAWNLDAHVMDGYEFVMQNYTVGDRICIFGFSRGAYTARALAGMIHKVGMLPACNLQQVPFAYKMFTREDEVGWQQSNAFKKAFSIDVDIEFIGVWDTVNSVGLIPRRLPFTTSNTIVRTFRHAVSLDEHRAKFKANLWNRPNATEAKLGITAAAPVEAPQLKVDGKKPVVHRENTLKALEAKYGRAHREQPTDIDEVWFAGCHCDIGGGSVSNDTTNNLARIPLRWMIRECFKTNSGIMFDMDGLRNIGLNPDALYPTVLPRPAALPVGTVRLQRIPPASSPQNKVAAPPTADSHASIPTEEELDLQNAMTPVYDQLALAWFWWILEFIPMKHRYQKDNNKWASYIGWNMGQGRTIPRQETVGVRVHRTVKARLEAEYEGGGKYVPKAKLDLEHVVWVD